jgi:hypothetical protein
MPNLVRRLVSVLSLFPSSERRECLKETEIDVLEKKVEVIEIRLRKLETDLVYSQQKVLLLEQRVLDYRTREIS